MLTFRSYPDWSQSTNRPDWPTARANQDVWILLVVIDSTDGPVQQRQDANEVCLFVGLMERRVSSSDSNTSGA